MDLRGLKELQKGVPGTVPVMVPDGKGSFVEATRARVVDMEFDDLDDGPAFVIDAGDDDEVQPLPERLRAGR